jgi:Holliday junction DNA helicase RuvA
MGCPKGVQCPRRTSRQDGPRRTIAPVIARLHGRVLALEDDAVILDVGGVGFRVHVPTSLLADLGPEGATATLHTHLVVRENEWLLVGAADREAMSLFELLLGVGGVGPRVALALLSVTEPAALRQAIVDEDVAVITRAPGVGRRTAERIVLELRGRLEATDRTGLPSMPLSGAQSDALEALVALGYSRGEARRALAQAQDVAEGAGVEERVMAALRTLSS